MGVIYIVASLPTKIRKQRFPELTLRFIPKGMVDNNLLSDRLGGLKALDPFLLQTADPLIARPLSESPNCAW